MAQERITVRCPDCRTKLLIHPSRQRVDCPKCGAASALINGVPHRLASQPHPGSELTTKEASGEGATSQAPDARPGFFRYFTGRWDRDRGGVVFKTLLGVLSAAALDLAKPVIGHRGMVAALAALAGLATVSFVLYASARTLAYITGTDRGEEERSRSPLAWIAYFGLIATVFAWGPMVIADSFSADRGWLATLSPALAERQARLLLARRQDPSSPGGSQEPGTSSGSTSGGPGNETKAAPVRTSGPATQSPEEPKSLADVEQEERARIEAENKARVEAKERIRAAEKTNDPIVARLIENLKDRSPSTRAQAANALQGMTENPEAQAAIPALIRLIVGDLDGQEGRYTNAERNKDAAVRALKALAPEKVKPTLLQAAESKPKGVRLWAVDWLTQPEDQP